VTLTDGYEQDHLDLGTDRLGLHHYPPPQAAPPGPGPTAPAAPLVTVWPAMGVPARWYRLFALALRSHGAQVVVADLRGTGSSTPPPSRESRYRLGDLVDDVGAVQEVVRERYGRRRELLVGHSLGGQAILLHEALTEQPTVDAIALVAVGLPYFRRYPLRVAAGLLPYSQGIAAVSTVLGVWPGWGFGGRQARGVIQDWAYTARTGRYPLIDGVDGEAALARVTTPVLAVSVEGDRLTPPSTVDHLVGKLIKAPVTREHYTAAQAGAALDHFRWVRAAEPLAARIATLAAG
jgi:predicted alpha/beta hydrolase